MEADDAGPPGSIGGAGPRSAVTKTMLVLEAVTAHPRVSSIAERTGLSVSTVHRILTDLVAGGWVHHDDRRYQPGRRLLALGSELTTAVLQPPHTESVLRRLVEQTGYTVHFAVLQDAEAVYVAKLDGRRAYSMRSRVGMALPLHSSAIGKAILAQLDVDRAARLLERTGLRAVTTRTVVDPAVLWRQLAQARRRGWSLDDSENELDTRCIGAAVVRPDGTPVGGVSLSALAFDLPLERVEELAPLVVERASALSAALTGSGWT